MRLKLIIINIALLGIMFSQVISSNSFSAKEEVSFIDNSCSQGQNIYDLSLDTDELEEEDLCIQHFDNIILDSIELEHCYHNYTAPLNFSHFFWKPPKVS